jgi:large subunit ribosomal protein L32e
MKFLRRSWDRYSKLGKRRKKKQVWRKPKGRDNKMREKRKGYPQVVSIGFRKNSRQREDAKDRKTRIVKNLKDLENINKHEIIIGKVGKKKKIEIIKKAKEKKIPIHKINPDKFLKKPGRIKNEPKK